MIYRLITLAILSGTAFAAPQFPLVNSSTPLSVDSLVAIGNRYSPVVRQSEQTLKLNRLGKMNAAGQFLPSLSLGGSFSENHYKTVTYTNPDGTVGTFPIVTDSGSVEGPEGSSRSSSQSISADLLIFDGAKRYYLYKMAKLQESINNLSLGDNKKQLARSVASQAVLVLTQEKLFDLSKRLRDQRQDAYDLAKARYEVGSVTELDVLQAQIALGRAENDITSTERTLQSTREQLNQLLGIDLRSSFPLEALAPPTPYEFDLDSLVSLAYRNRTDLNIADLNAKQANYELLRSKQDYLPTASLGASWSRDEQSGTNESWTLNPRNRNSSYFLRLNWNLFDGFSRELSIGQQKVNRNQALEQVRQLSLTLEQDVRNAYYDLENSFNQLQITARNRDLAQRTLELERERYRLGATSQLALRDAQVTYAQAETDDLSKQFEYQTNLIALELAVGKELR